MGFSHAQATVSTDNFTNGSTSTSVSLASAPSVGDVVCVAIGWFNSAITISSVQDGNSNVYIQSPSSPDNANNAFGIISLYYFIASGTPHQTVTITHTALVSANADIMSMIVDDFSVGGSAAFDKDLNGHVTVSTASPVNTPSLTPTSPSSLMYAAVINNNSTDVLHSPWAGFIDTTFSSLVGEYQLGASSSQNPNISYTGVSKWSAIIVTFYIPAQGLGAAIQDDQVWLGGDQE